MRSDTFGALAYYSQIAVYLVIISYSIIRTFKPTIQWFLLTRLGFFHLIMCVALLSFALYIRIRLPKTIDGFANSLLIVWAIGSGYELFFDTSFALYQLHTTAPVAFNLANDAFGAIGVAMFFVTKAYKNFNLKILGLGVLAYCLGTVAWIVFAGYHVSVCSCAYHYQYALDLGVNAWEMFVWTLWLAAAFLGFERHVRKTVTE